MEQQGVTDQGWPEDWGARKAGANCPLCSDIGRDTATDHALHVTELAASEVRLERRSRLPGYCVVIWRHSHVAEATELKDEEATQYWLDVLAVARAIEQTFQPMKMNLLTLGNWVPHLHTHVLPRYIDDPAPGGPITWADIFATEPTDPAMLREHASRIRGALAIHLDQPATPKT
jgi:diadenosine tetraphosphate (Ap4A) HIT family hydrolase